MHDADDFSRMVVAWTKNDPDGNGQPDTFGLGGNGPADFCITTINNIFRVPNGWRLNPDGTLVSALETDEFRQGITFARRLHEAGAYHPDTATMTNQQAKDGFTGGKIGAWYDNANLSVGGQRDTLRENNPASKVAALIPPGFDGGKGFASNSTGYFGYVATPAKVGRDRERVKELLRLLNYFAAPFGSEEYVFLRYGLPGVHYDIKDGEPVSTAAGKADIVDLRNLANPPEVFYLPKPGDAEYLQNVMKELVPIGIDNPTQTLFSAAAAAKGAELTQLDRDRRTAIITGREPLSALDGWIRDWRSRGGDEIRKEYEQDLKGQ
jgi:putative aldouronate transport system substrate-binding protein